MRPVLLEISRSMPVYENFCCGKMINPYYRLVCEANSAQVIESFRRENLDNLSSMIILTQ